MRVAVFGRLTGGVGVHARSLISGLLDADPALRIDLVTPDVAPELERLPRFTRHPVEGRAWTRLPTHPGWLVEAALYGRAARRLAGVDLAHFVDARTSLFAPRSRIALVGTMNDYYYADASDLSTLRRIYRDWPPRWVLYRVTRSAERRALLRLDRVIAISAAVSTRVARAYGIDASRFDVVPMGFDFPAVRRDVTAVETPRRVLFVGGNFQRKGLGVLIDAAPAVLERHADVRFVVVGRSFAEGALRRAARQRSVAASFEFLGPVSHARLWELYASAGLLTMPSLLEAFGIPYLEAMSAGLPVVATDTSGPDEFLRDGDNAVVVPPGDAAALARGILRILESAELRLRLQRGGRETAARFGRARVARETLAVYREAVAWR